MTDFLEQCEIVTRWITDAKDHHNPPMVDGNYFQASVRVVVEVLDEYAKKLEARLGKPHPLSISMMCESLVFRVEALEELEMLEKYDLSKNHVRKIIEHSRDKIAQSDIIYLTMKYELDWTVPYKEEFYFRWAILKINDITGMTPIRQEATLHGLNFIFDVNTPLRSFPFKDYNLNSLKDDWLRLIFAIKANQKFLDRA